MQNNNVHFRAIYICNESMKICTGMKSIKYKTVIFSEGEANTTWKEFSFKRSLVS